MLVLISYSPNFLLLQSAPLGSAEDRAKMDSEYTALMAELGVAELPTGGTLAHLVSIDISELVTPPLSALLSKDLRARTIML